MKTFALTIAILVIATAAYAACTTYTVFLPDGQVQICLQCCDQFGRNCTVTCV